MYTEHIHMLFEPLKDHPLAQQCYSLQLIYMQINKIDPCKFLQGKYTYSIRQICKGDGYLVITFLLVFLFLQNSQILEFQFFQILNQNNSDGCKTTSYSPHFIYCCYFYIVTTLNVSKITVSFYGPMSQKLLIEQARNPCNQ